LVQHIPVPRLAPDKQQTETVLSSESLCRGSFWQITLMASAWHVVKTHYIWNRPGCVCR